LQELRVPIPRIHDLDDILDLLIPRDPTLQRLRLGLNLLTQYAVEYRYPGMTANTRQANSAIRLAEKVRKEIRIRLGIRERRRKRP
jgi:hypothetical protein